MSALVTVTIIVTHIHFLQTNLSVPSTRIPTGSSSDISLLIGGSTPAIFTSTSSSATVSSPVYFPTGPPLCPTGNGTYVTDGSGNVYLTRCHTAYSGNNLVTESAGSPEECVALCSSYIVRDERGPCTAVSLESSTTANNCLLKYNIEHIEKDDPLVNSAVLVSRGGGTNLSTS